MKAVNEGRAAINYASGGVVSRNIVQHTGVHGRTADYGRIRDYATRESSAAGRAMSRDLGGQATRAAASAAISAAKAAQAAAAAAAMASSSGSTFHGKLPGGTGAAGIRAIARALGASYIAPHRDPQGGPAFDLGSSGAKNDRIAAALISRHGPLGLRYVIHRMKIASARSGWRNRAYHPITGSGDFRHVNHVHVSYDRGGWINEPVHGVGRSGKTYSFAERRPEYVSPRGRGGGAVHYHYTINAPHYVGPERELVKVLVDANRRGQLDVIKR
jgi:hypothetical protein